MVPPSSLMQLRTPYQTVVDDISVRTIVLEKTPSFHDLTKSMEYYDFDAYTNAINLEREYYQEFTCEFDLYYYPFDTQIDSIGVEYTGKHDIENWKTFFDNSGEMSQAEVNIVFRRNVKFNFTDRVMVMLVIATINASIQIHLPATSYFKMIDIWLFFSMNRMVLSLIFHAYLGQVVEKGKSDSTISSYQRSVSVK